MTRSLFVAPQWIGDAVMTEPLLRELHRRGEQITVAALPWVAPIYQHMPSVAEVIELPFKHGKLQWSERRALGRQWRGMFDRAYVAPNSFKSALIPWLACIPERIGYHGESRYGLLTQRLLNPPRGERPPMVDFYLALSGKQGDSHHRVQPVLQRATESVRQTLQANGLQARCLHSDCSWRRVWTGQDVAGDPCGRFVSVDKKPSGAVGFRQRA
jgi:heptosyltransferase II